jgi:nucleoside-diphosphate-sugar epimerase
MTTLVTGAFGCIGAWVIRGLLAAGERPVVFDLGDDAWRVRMIAGPDAPERLTLGRGDVTDKAQIERVVRDHEVRRIIHLAAFVYTEDVARAFLTAAAARLDGARVYNLHGASASVADVVRVIESPWPPAKGLITHVAEPLPFPAALDDARYQKDLGPAPSTSLIAGVQKTLDEFRHLQQSGRLDARELT